MILNWTDRHLENETHFTKCQHQIVEQDFIRINNNFIFIDLYDIYVVFGYSIEAISPFINNKMLIVNARVAVWKRGTKMCFFSLDSIKIPFKMIANSFKIKNLFKFLKIH